MRVFPIASKLAFQNVREVTEIRRELYSKLLAESSKKSHKTISSLIISEATSHFGNLSHHVTDRHLHQSEARQHQFALSGLSFPQRNYPFFYSGKFPDKQHFKAHSRNSVGQFASDQLLLYAYCLESWKVNLV